MGGSVLMVEETEVPRENHWPSTSHWQTLLHNVQWRWSTRCEMRWQVFSAKTYQQWSRFELTTSMVIGTDCIGSCKFNYHTITATIFYTIGQ